MKPIWNYPPAWLFVVVAAVVLAFASPRHPHALGRLPNDVGHKLEAIPASVPYVEDRLLVLVTFHRDQRPAAESWIRGLKLHEGAVAWVRMPVVEDPGDPALRAQAELRLLARYGGSKDRGNLLPVFTDRDAFVRSAGLGDVSQPVMLVINRQGDVLARVAGDYDERKAATIQLTLSARDL